MPAVREHVDLPTPFEDDDDMPPLVDNPMPSMTFTFATDMTPLTYAGDNYAGCDYPPPPDPATMFIMSPPSSPSLGPVRSKRKDSTHIPRPPNAFILFRSSFIKAQHIPDKIEGNHSSLSKIIGMYWKSLPNEERKVWEGKAVAAQTEHRQKYPDWRFRPGNIIGKVKDGPRKRGSRKGRGDAEEEEKNRQKRCTKIARLLEEGMKGAILEDAVREYDRETGPAVEIGKKEGRQSRKKAKQPIKVESPEELPVIQEEKTIRTRAQSQDIRFTVPLTNMFKRSSSLPAVTTRGASPDAFTGTPQSISVATPSPCPTPSTGFLHEDRACDIHEMSPLPSPALTSLPTPDFQYSLPFLPVKNAFPLPSLDEDTDYGSPASSTMDYILTPNSTPAAIPEDSWHLSEGIAMQIQPVLSTYSSLTGWAGTEEPHYQHLVPLYFEPTKACHELNNGWWSHPYAPLYPGGPIANCALAA